MDNLDSMATDMAELFLDNIDKKKMYLASVARKIRSLLIKRKYNDSNYMHLFEQLVDLEDELMGEIEKRHGL
jgi:hypothetical protein